MKKSPSWLLSLVLLLAGTSSEAAPDPFAEMVRSSDPLPAGEQLKRFRLPPGFEIQLVASEPEIGKPMNIAFDSRGRLWLTQSREYPFAAPENQPGRDKVLILDRFAENGRAWRITTFADGLNIPIGLYPYKNGALVFSIPNIYFLQDTDGDGRADRRELFLGRFGWELDTHGMTGAFRRGYDGWLYADHGFRNDSTLTASDGSRVQLNSGNTYRVRMDGSRVEAFTRGQVNPFGLAFDHLGDLWSADCHSSPVYMLLRGAYYPSFGKPHDGLGFAPMICAHSHGSTAIAGMAYYTATNFPAEYRHNTFIGNVMTSRVNRDSYIEHGSTRIAKEERDFLVCDDPWFRPVDLQVGPDGALYIADFYNRIIGHYEVPLDHPGRDRERGRIWRVVYTGARHRSPLALPGTVEELIVELKHPNLTRRMLAMDALSDRFGPEAVRPLKQVLQKTRGVEPVQKIHAAWLLHRLGALEESTLRKLARDSNREVRVHAMRIASETANWTSKLHGVVLTALNDSDPYVKRAAADALGQHPQFENIQPLLGLRHRVDPKDSQLLHVTRMALRNQLLDAGAFRRLLAVELSPEDSRAVADVTLGVRSGEAAQFLLKHVTRVEEAPQRMHDYLRHIARHAPGESDFAELVRVTRGKFGSDVDFQLQLLRSVIEGGEQRGGQLPSVVQEWSEALAEQLLGSHDPDEMPWRNVITGNSENPWRIETRHRASGQKNVKVISSFAPGKEHLTGILRSKEFKLPARLRFSVAGHDGYPDKPAGKKNLVRLREAGSGRVLAEVFAPRNDVAQPVDWKLADHAGKMGYLEVVDGNSGSAYAWIAITALEPAVVPFPAVNPNEAEKRLLSAMELVERFRLGRLENQLAGIVRATDVSDAVRGAAVRALVSLKPADYLSMAGEILLDAGRAAALRGEAASAIAKANLPEGRRLIARAVEESSGTFQTLMAVLLAGNSESAATLVQGVESGRISARLLQEAGIKDRIKAVASAETVSLAERLTAGLRPVSEEKQKLIEQKRAAFNPGRVSIENGRRVFAQSCAICHQLGGEGAVVGPQLDGIGNRGLDRLLEDILDPNRNVDHAFRYSNVTLKDEQVITGLFRREEGEVLVFADATGQEISVRKSEIDQRQDSENSLMPDNFHEILSEEELNDLLAFLLTKRSTQ